MDEIDAMRQRLEKMERERDAYRDNCANLSREVLATRGLASRAERLAEALRRLIYRIENPSPCVLCRALCGKHKSDCEVPPARAALADAPEPRPCPECERLRASCAMACECPRDDCECPGCSLAASCGGDVDQLLADRAPGRPAEEKNDE